MINKFFHKLAKRSLDLSFLFQLLSDKCMEFFTWCVSRGYFELPYTLEEIEANQKAEQEAWEEFQRGRNNGNHRN